MNILHGTEHMESQFQITQHRYAGSDPDTGPAYIEVLEIHDPPEAHRSFIFHYWQGGSGQSLFFECQTITEANVSFELAFSGALITPRGVRHEIFNHVRAIHYSSPQTPWFYTAPGTEIHGDFAR